MCRHVYGWQGANKYSSLSRNELLLELKAHQESLPELSPDIIKRMLRQVRAADGNVYFDDLQNEISKQRELRVKQLRDKISKGASTENQTVIQPPPPLFGRGVLDVKGKTEKLTYSDCFDVTKKLSNPARYRVTTALSHKNSHKIAPVENQKSAEVATNSMLLCRECSTQAVRQLCMNSVL